MEKVTERIAQSVALLLMSNGYCTDYMTEAASPTAKWYCLEDVHVLRSGRVLKGMTYITSACSLAFCLRDGKTDSLRGDQDELEMLLTVLRSMGSSYYYHCVMTAMEQLAGERDRIVAEYDALNRAALVFNLID